MDHTKSDIIETVALKRNVPVMRAKMIVEQIFDAMVEALLRGESIELRGFGSFTIREYRPHKGRDPRTGEPVQVPRKRMPFFKVGKELRERVGSARVAATLSD